mmetsp:Transcript_28623/g.91296  ORF Transcript_28623/g.91296 Transcript_28623/m.91296 type:complete len:1178 (-) Transcript_28623:42-3575(-)
MCSHRGESIVLGRLEKGGASTYNCFPRRVFGAYNAVPISLFATASRASKHENFLFHVGPDDTVHRSSGFRGDAWGDVAAVGEKSVTTAETADGTFPLFGYTDLKFSASFREVFRTKQYSYLKPAAYAFHNDGYLLGCSTGASTVKLAMDEVEVYVREPNGTSASSAGPGQLSLSNSSMLTDARVSDLLSETPEKVWVRCFRATEEKGTTASTEFHAQCSSSNPWLLISRVSSRGYPGRVFGAYMRPGYNAWSFASATCFASQNTSFLFKWNYRGVFQRTDRELENDAQSFCTWSTGTTTWPVIGGTGYSTADIGMYNSRVNLYAKAASFKGPGYGDAWLTGMDASYAVTDELEFYQAVDRPTSRSALLTTAMRDQLEHELGAAAGGWSLCHRGSEHGFETKTFWTRCAAKGSTLIVGRVKDSALAAGEEVGRVFGGYAHPSWSLKTSTYQKGLYSTTLPYGGFKKHSFLFKFNSSGSLERTQGLHGTPTIATAYEREITSHYPKIDNGPAFGWTDTAISGYGTSFMHNFALGIGAASDMSVGYTGETGVYNVSSTWLTGAQFFEVDEIEVYFFRGRRTGRATVNVPQPGTHTVLLNARLPDSTLVPFTAVITRPAAPSPSANLAANGLAISPGKIFEEYPVSISQNFTPSSLGYSTGYVDYLVNKVNVDIITRRPDTTVTQGTCASGDTCATFGTMTEGDGALSGATHLLTGSMLTDLGSNLPGGLSGWKRCYSGKEQNFGSGIGEQFDFAWLCGNRGRTVTLARVGGDDGTGTAQVGRVFGAYNPTAWIWDAQYRLGTTKMDPNMEAFLFKWGGGGFVRVNSTDPSNVLSAGTAALTGMSWGDPDPASADHVLTFGKDGKMNRGKFTNSSRYGFGPTDSNSWPAGCSTCWVLDALEVYYKEEPLSGSSLITAAQATQLEARIGPSQGWVRLFQLSSLTALTHNEAGKLMVQASSNRRMPILAIVRHNDRRLGAYRDDAVDSAAPLHGTFKRARHGDFLWRAVDNASTVETTGREVLNHQTFAVKTDDEFVWGLGYDFWCFPAGSAAHFYCNNAGNQQSFEYPVGANPATWLCNASSIQLTTDTASGFEIWGRIVKDHSSDILSGDQKEELLSSTGLTVHDGTTPGGAWSKCFDAKEEGAGFKCASSVSCSLVIMHCLSNMRPSRPLVLYSTYTSPP